jgi:hypothetical protein
LAEKKDYNNNVLVLIKEPPSSEIKNKNAPHSKKLSPD